MKNLKKLFAVIVVVAMLATLAVPAFAAVPSDVQGTEYENAVGRLVALGIITGRPDGSFAPDETITRAEFAAVVVRSLGYDTAAAAAKGQTKFSDVAADFWAAGYINLANSLGIINGRPDGTFGANDPVRFEEAITMIVRALGYEPKAKTLGGYPAGYLAIASQEDIDEDVNGATGMFAPRGLVAQLVNNSLEVPMMEQTGFGTETYFSVNDDKTLIGTFLKLKKYEVQIVSTGTKLEVKYEPDTTKIDNDDKAGTKEKLSVFEGINTAGLEDAYATLFVKDGTVYALKLDSQIYYGHVEAVDGESDPFENVRTGLLQPPATNNPAIDTDDPYEVTVAGMDLDITSGTDVVNPSIATTDELLNNGFYAKAVVKDGKTEMITYYELDEGGIITAVDNKSIEYIKGDDDSVLLRGLDKADSMTVIINDEIAAYDDLEEDMVFDVTETSGDYLIVATNNKVEGELTGAGYPVTVEIDDKVIFVDDIGGSYYSTDEGKVYADANDDLVTDLLGTDVVAYVGPAGDVRYIKGATDASTADFYGLVLGSGQTRGVNWVKVVREIDGAASVVTYDLTANLKSGSVTFNTTNDFYANVIYRFSINADGDINKMVTVSDQFDTTAASFNKNADTIVHGGGNVYVGKNTVLISEYDTDKYKIVEWADIEDKLASGGSVSFISASADGFAKLVVFDNQSLDGIAGADEYVAFVSSYKKVVDGYELTLVTPDGTVKKISDDIAPDANGPRNNFLVYSDSGTNSIAADYLVGWGADTDVDLSNPTLGTVVSGTVYAKETGYIALHAAPSTLYRFADDIAVYEVSGASNQNFDASTTSSIRSGDNTTGNTTATGDAVKMYVVNGRVKAIFYNRQAK